MHVLSSVKDPEMDILANSPLAVWKEMASFLGGD